MTKQANLKAYTDSCDRDSEHTLPGPEIGALTAYAGQVGRAIVTFEEAMMLFGVVEQLDDGTLVNLSSIPIQPILLLTAQLKEELSTLITEYLIPAMGDDDTGADRGEE